MMEPLMAVGIVVQLAAAAPTVADKAVDSVAVVLQAVLADTERVSAMLGLGLAAE